MMRVPIRKQENTTTPTLDGVVATQLKQSGEHARKSGAP
jgi:hypothetical protein